MKKDRAFDLDQPRLVYITVTNYLSLGPEECL
jgi:hypothetical protein